LGRLFCVTLKLAGEYVVIAALQRKVKEMWWYRLHWFLQVRFGRQAVGFRPKPGGLLAVIVLIGIGTAGLAVLSLIWKVMMQGFLGSTPWVAGNQVGTYYWSSAMFALKSTLIIGAVLLLLMFFLGYQLNRLLKR